MESVNLATQLDDQELKSIAQVVYEEYEYDEKSREGWLEKRAGWLEIYNQLDRTSGETWQSNDCFPILTEGCNLFQARFGKAFFPSRDFLTAISSEEKNSSEILQAAERIATHLNYQLSIQDKSYKQDKIAMALAASQGGSDFTKAYRNPLKNKNVIERVRAVDLVVPYGTGPMRLEDIERKTHIIYMTINNSKILAKGGYFTSPATKMDANYDSKYQDVVDEAQGLERPYLNDYNQTACLLEQHRLLDLDGDGIAEPYTVTIDKTSKEIKRISIRYDVDENGNPTNNKEPIEYFTAYHFLTNPDGFYGLGYGHLIGSLNLAINKLLRQTIDAATLANAGNMSGYISESLGIKGGDNDISIGRMKKIPKSMDDIRKGIYLMQFPGANPTLVNALQMLISAAQRISSTTDLITGDIQKVLQPTTVMSLLEAGLQLPSSIMEQMAFSFEDELSKLYRLNQKYMDTPEVIPGAKESTTVTPQDYQYSFRIVPIIDPKQITQQQRIAKSQELFQFSMNNPVIAQNPQAMEEVTRRYLMSLDIEDIDLILPPKEEPQRIDDPDVENMYYLMPLGEAPLFDVFPDQDHHAHILQIDSLMNILEGIEEPLLKITDPVILQTVQSISAQEKEEIITGLMQHRRKHVAYLYGSMTHGQRQDGGMAPTGGNPMGPEQLGGSLPAGGDMALLFGQGGENAGTAGGFEGDQGSDQLGGAQSFLE